MDNLPPSVAANSLRNSGLMCFCGASAAHVMSIYVIAK